MLAGGFVGSGMEGVGFCDLVSRVVSDFQMVKDVESSWYVSQPDREP